MKNNFTRQIEIIGPPVYYDVNGAPLFELKYYQFQTVDDKIVLNQEFVENLRKTVCQGCGRSFIVECCHPVYNSTDHCHNDFGDPPVHNCVGDTMSTTATLKLKDSDIEGIIERHVFLNPIKIISSRNETYQSKDTKGILFAAAGDPEVGIPPIRFVFKCDADIPICFDDESDIKSFIDEIGEIIEEYLTGEPTTGITLEEIEQSEKWIDKQMNPPEGF